MSSDQGMVLGTVRELHERRGIYTTYAAPCLSYLMHPFRGFASRKESYTYLARS